MESFSVLGCSGIDWLWDSVGHKKGQVSNTLWMNFKMMAANCLPEIMCKIFGR